MRLFALEHSRMAYRADFIAYGLASVALASVLAIAAPRELGGRIATLAAAGLLGWPLLEYLMHRFVLHGLRPFSTWHAAHHQRPAALISSPTLFSASLFLALVFLPAWLVSDAWSACALTFGLLTGYLAYALTHHAMHHGPARFDWIRRRRLWHARHHAREGAPGQYGVTTGVWDRIFRTADRAPDAPIPPDSHDRGRHVDVRSPTSPRTSP